VPAGNAAKSSTDVIREALPADVPALVAAYDWLLAPPVVRPPASTPADAPGGREATRGNPPAAVLLSADNKVVGFATVYLDIVSVRFGQRAWVEDLAVAPHRRSGGIGKALLDAAKLWARDHGAARLELESGSARLDAHRFYEREDPDGWARSFRWTL
jgi:GNAT superfamily N-acetyltransferase